MAAGLWLLVAIGIHYFKSIWVTIALFHMGILTSLWLHRGVVRPGVLLKGWHTGWMVVNAAIALFVGAVICFAWDTLGIDRSALKTLGFGAGKWGLLIYFSTVNPVLEELFWRALPPWVSPAPAGDRKPRTPWLSPSDIAFAGYHVIVVSGFAGYRFCLVTFAGLLCGAVIWRRLYHTLGGLSVPLVAHGLIDLVLIESAIIHVH